MKECVWKVIICVILYGAVAHSTFNPFLLGRFQTQPTNIHLFSFVSMQIQLQDKEFA